MINLFDKPRNPHAGIPCMPYPITPSKDTWLIYSKFCVAQKKFCPHIINCHIVCSGCVWLFRTFDCFVLIILYQYQCQLWRSCLLEITCTVLCKKNANEIRYFLRVFGAFQWNLKKFWVKRFLVQSSSNFQKAYCFIQNDNSGRSSEDGVNVHVKYHWE